MTIWAGMMRRRNRQHRFVDMNKFQSLRIAPSYRDAALTLQRRFVNSVPLVFYTERSTAGVKMNHRIIHTESCAAAPKET